MMGGLVDALADFAARNPGLRLDLLGHLALAALLGGAIGWEREHKDKPAGLRTNILICVGAALLTDLGLEIARASDGPADPARISAQIVSGIGFLGAGTILQSRGSVSGLTTAATLWVVAAIGMAAGAGRYVEATGTALLVLVVLIPLRWLEDRAESLSGAEEDSDGDSGGAPKAGSEPGP
jgi:putative Mg2+ transporter-C (MgtC) family protein